VAPSGAQTAYPAPLAVPTLDPYPVTATP
jgi:hypothetical protein